MVVLISKSSSLVFVLTGSCVEYITRHVSGDHRSFAKCPIIVFLERLERVLSGQPLFQGEYARLELRASVVA